MRNTAMRSLGAVVLGSVVLIAAACAPAPTKPTTTTTTTTTAPTTVPTTTTVPPTTTTVPTTTTTVPTTTTTTTTVPPTTTTTVPGPVRTAIAATCQGSAIGQTQTSALSTGVSLLAPATATAGSTFQAKLTADPIIVPSTAGANNEYSIQNLNTIKVRFDVPAGATFVSASLSGGSNLGTGAPTVALSGSQVVVSIPGNLAPGTTATLPTVTATFTASGAVSTSLPWKLSGTSYSNPGITFTARVSNVPFLGTINVATSCYGNPNPVLGTTTIN